MNSKKVTVFVIYLKETMHYCVLCWPQNCKKKLHPFLSLNFKNWKLCFLKQKCLVYYWTDNFNQTTNVNKWLFLDVNTLAVNVIIICLLLLLMLQQHSATKVIYQDEGTHVFGCKRTSYIDHGLNEWLNNGFKC